MSLTTAFNERKENPVFQAILVGSIASLIMLLVKVTEGEDLLGRNWEQIWVVMVMFLLFFSLLNSVICLSVKDQNKYFGKSIMSFAGLMGILCLVAYGLSSVSWYDSGFFRWITVVVSIGYLVFLSIVMLMFRIVQYAQKQDKKLRNEE